MDHESNTQLAQTTEKLAAAALERLERQMEDPACEPKKLRDLSALARELFTLAGELRGEEGREVTVCFVGETERASF